jgi:hypothetical protein
MGQPYIRVAGTDHKLKADDVAEAMNILTAARKLQVHL